MSRPASVVDVIERTRPAHELRPDLHLLWCDGFRAGAAARDAEVANLRHVIAFLEWEIDNPQWRRDLARDTLAQMDAVRAREQVAARRAVLDRLERTDLFEYRRLAHLRLTDEPAYLTEIDKHLKENHDRAVPA